MRRKYDLRSVRFPYGTMSKILSIMEKDISIQSVNSYIVESVEESIRESLLKQKRNLRESRKQQEAIDSFENQKLELLNPQKEPEPPENVVTQEVSVQDSTPQESPAPKYIQGYDYPKSIQEEGCPVHKNRLCGLPRGDGWYCMILKKLLVPEIEL